MGPVTERNHERGLKSVASPELDTSNENKMSDGHRERALIEAKRL